MTFWKKASLPLTIVVPGIIVIALIATQKPKPQPELTDNAEAPKPQVHVQKAVPKSTVISVTTQGMVAPKREIDLIAQVSGQVQKVERAFVSGGFFSADELLIQIEDRDYRAAYLATQSLLAAAQQRLAEERGRVRQAKSEWRDLGNRDANELFLRKPQLTAAEAAVASAQAEVARAQLNLERTQIRVPFNGRIRETYVGLGQYVSPGTRIATVYDSAVVEIRLPLSDRQVGLVNLPIGYAAADRGQAPKVKISGTIGGERYQWQGHITRTDASIDTQSRMIFAVAEVENPFTSAAVEDGRHPLVVGLFVDAEIEGKALDNVIVLPRDAVFKQDKMYVLNDEHTIEETSARVLHRTREQVWVKNSLATNQLIVLEKQALLAPGAIVAPVFEEGSPSALAESPTEGAPSITPSADTSDVTSTLESNNASKTTTSEEVAAANTPSTVATTTPKKEALNNTRKEP